MGEDSELLKKLVESVADGDPVDWDAIAQLELDDHLKRLVGHLRVIAEVGEVHRSRVDEVGETPPVAKTHAAAPAEEDAPGPAHEADEAHPPVPPRQSPRGADRWGHLQLVRKIGEGAFGEVFLAHDPWLDHSVALKLLKPDVTGSALQTKILHEARKLVRVRHPNVVTVHGADKHDGRIGFWMDFVDGQTLGEWASAGRLSAGEATHAGQELCRALAAVHQANIVHRDIKAQNVMRAADGGRIILMDFGAGEFIDDPVLRVREGTPLYLAPEILNGGMASVQSDVYAVGVLLYHLVTHAFPVVGSSIESLTAAHREGRRRRLSDVRADLPDAFVAVVERALDPDPERRFGSAGEMYVALGGGRLEPVATTSTLTSIQEPEPIRRWARVAVGATGAGAAVFLTGFIATRVFEAAVRIDPAFRSGLSDYMRVGLEAALPFGAYWALAALAYAAVAGVNLVLAPRLGAVRRASRALLDRSDVTLVAGAVLLTGIASWFVLTWAFFGIFAGLGALQEAAANQPIDSSILSPAAHDFHRAHGIYSAYCSFALAAAVWQFFPALARRASNPRPIAAMRWATLAVAMVVVVTATAPRRVIWERFEVVLFENQASVVVGRSSSEVMLYAPQRTTGRYRRVLVDDARLARTGVRQQIFEQAPLPQ